MVVVVNPGLDRSVWFDLHQRLTDTDGTASASLHLIRQEMKVSQKQLGEFCEALKQYLKNVSAQRDCFQHLQSAACKAFQHVKVDTLSQPEVMSTVAVPAVFFPMKLGFTFPIPHEHLN
ncbi:hypothetical protein QTP70_013152 [Hemibagrus guttatus]|uniref:Uncharacterized protein n=1 Tax=Hemibagrus guttatus TaxID=175788 RepID=A0AAE0VBQ1_9TELE|nr:hypothetical protein QTP70_013152 [Hemibagrus guttatus]